MTGPLYTDANTNFSKFKRRNGKGKKRTQPKFSLHSRPREDFSRKTKHLEKTIWPLGDNRSLLISPRGALREEAGCWDWTFYDVDVYEPNPETYLKRVWIGLFVWVFLDLSCPDKLYYCYWRNLQYMFVLFFLL